MQTSYDWEALSLLFMVLASAGFIVLIILGLVSLILRYIRNSI